MYVGDKNPLADWIKFGDDRLSGLASAEGQILPFPIDFDGRSYNTLILPCERVMWINKQKQIFDNFRYFLVPNLSKWRCHSTMENNFQNWKQTVKIDLLIFQTAEVWHLWWSKKRILFSCYSSNQQDISREEFASYVPMLFRRLQEKVDEQWTQATAIPMIDSRCLSSGLEL